MPHIIARPDGEYAAHPLDRTMVHTVIVRSSSAPRKGQEDEFSSYVVTEDGSIQEVRGSDYVVGDKVEGDVRNYMTVNVIRGKDGVTSEQEGAVLDVVELIQRAIVHHGADVVAADKGAESAVALIHDVLQRGGGRDTGASPRRTPADAEALPATGTIADKPGVNLPPGGTYETDVKVNKIEDFTDFPREHVASEDAEDPRPLPGEEPAGKRVPTPPSPVEPQIRWPEK